MYPNRIVVSTIKIVNDLKYYNANFVIVIDKSREGARESALRFSIF